MHDGERVLEKFPQVTKRGGVWATCTNMPRCVAAILGAMLLFSCQFQIAQASVEQERTSAPRFSRDLEDAIQKAAERHSVPQSALRAFAAIESGGNPRASTGSYHGVFQLSHGLFQKYGGRGSIYDLQQNTDVAARKLRAEADAFHQRYGRAPDAVELYMIHQQGIKGAEMHMSQPDLPAWQNMHRTGEGKKRGAVWARLAIWGNVPTDQRAKFPGGVDGITSRQFMDMWARKMARFGGDVETPIVRAGLM
jgi:hypothetical protein